MRVFTIFNIGTGHNVLEPFNILMRMWEDVDAHKAPPREKTAAAEFDITEADDDWLTEDRVKLINDGPASSSDQPGTGNRFDDLNPQGDMEEILKHTRNMLKKWLKANSEPATVNMVGHSRGAILCIVIAKELHEKYKDSSPKCNLFLIDPVKRLAPGISKNLSRDFNDEEAYRIHSNTRSYVHLVMEDDDSGFKFPLVTKIGRHTKEDHPTLGRQDRIIIMPGTHGTAVQGNPVTEANEIVKSHNKPRWPIGEATELTIREWLSEKGTTFSTDKPNNLDIINAYSRIVRLNPITEPVRRITLKKPSRKSMSLIKVIRVEGRMINDMQVYKSGEEQVIKQVTGRREGLLNLYGGEDNNETRTEQQDPPQQVTDRNIYRRTEFFINFEHWIRFSCQFPEVYDCIASSINKSIKSKHGNRPNKETGNKPDSRNLKSYLEMHYDDMATKAAYRNKPTWIEQKLEAAKHELLTMKQYANAAYLNLENLGYSVRKIDKWIGSEPSPGPSSDHNSGSGSGSEATSSSFSSGTHSGSRSSSSTARSTSSSSASGGRSLSGSTVDPMVEWAKFLAVFYETYGWYSYLQPQAIDLQHVWNIAVITRLRDKAWEKWEEDKRRPAPGRSRSSRRPPSGKRSRSSSDSGSDTESASSSDSLPPRPSRSGRRPGSGKGSRSSSDFGSDTESASSSESSSGSESSR